MKTTNPALRTERGKFWGKGKFARSMQREEETASDQKHWCRQDLYAFGTHEHGTFVHTPRKDYIRAMPIAVHTSERLYIVTLSRSTPQSFLWKVDELLKSARSLLRVMSRKEKRLVANEFDFHSMDIHDCLFTRTHGDHGRWPSLRIASACWEIEQTYWVERY